MKQLTLKLTLVALISLLAGLALPCTVLAGDWTDGFNGSVGNWTLRTGTAMTYSTAYTHGTYTGAGAMLHPTSSSEMYRSTGLRPYHTGIATACFYDPARWAAGYCGNSYRQLLGFAGPTYSTYQLAVGHYSAGSTGDFFRRDSGSSYTSIGTKGGRTSCTGGWIYFVIEFQADGDCYRRADDGLVNREYTAARSSAVINAGVGMVTLGLGASSANQGYWDDISWDGYNPGPPTGQAATANSISQITWTANAASDNNQFGFALMNGGTEEEVSSTTARATSASFIRTGLSPNTAYTRGIRAWNGDNNSATATAITRYTLQNTPTTPTFGTITVDTIVLNATGPVNLTGNSGVYFDSTTSGGDGGINAWVQALTDTATGLSPNTQYTFQAKARNGDSAETVYSGTATTWTLSVPPGAGTVTPDNATVCSGSTVTWTAVNGFGAGKVAKYKYAWNQNASYTWSGSESDWSSGTIQTTPTAAGAWYLHVKGYNGANVANGTYDYAVTANAQPTAPNAGYNRGEGSSLKIKIADLITAPDSIQSLGTPTYGTVSKDTTYIYYSPNAGDNHNDSFTYTAVNANSCTAQATINVTVDVKTGQVQTIEVKDGKATMTFAGIPGFSYTVQRGENVNFTGTVTDLLTTNLPATPTPVGVFTFEEATSLTEAYYRLKYNP